MRDIMSDTNDRMVAFFEPAPEPVPEAVAEQIAETPEPTAVPEPTLLPEAELDEPDTVETPQGRMVPLKAVQHSRQRARDAEKRAVDAAEALAKAQGERDAFQRQLEAAQKVAQHAPVAVSASAPLATLPNPVEDPQGYAAAVRAQVMEGMFLDRLAESRAEYVKANSQAEFDKLASEWGELQAADPALVEQIRRAANPLAFAAQHVKRAKRLKEIGDDPDAYIEQQIAARLTQVVPAALPVVPATVQQRAAPPAVPASLAASRSTGPRGNEQPASGFDALFVK